MWHASFFIGNCLWKYFPSRIYKEYAENEEKIYNIILEIIKNTIQNNEFMAQDKENESILVKILKTEGLDIRDKISGVIGKSRFLNTACLLKVLHETKLDFQNSLLYRIKKFLFPK